MDSAFLNVGPGRDLNVSLQSCLPPSPCPACLACMCRLRLDGLCPPDLKASNVLVDSVLRAKVSDFGLARYCLDGGRRSKSAGSALWMAPELLRGGQPTLASDVYSYGILMTEVK